MKRLFMTMGVVLAALSGCGQKEPALEQVPEPSYYKNATYFTEKFGMYDMIPVVENDIVMVGDDYIDRGLWTEFFGMNNIKNRGITYDGTEHVLYRIDKIAQGKPAKLFLSVGYNDVVRGVEVDTSVVRIGEIFNRVSKISPKTKLYYINAIASSEEIAGKIEELNSKVLELSRSGLFEYIDADTPMRDGIRSGKYSYNEGLHLNGAGYAAFCQVFERQIGVQHRNVAVEWNYENEFFDYYKARATIFSSCPADSHKVVMLGDSMNNNASWGELFPDVDLINRGISGDTAGGILQRLDEVISHNPEKIFLLTGPNDFINDKELTPEGLWASYEKLVTAVRTALPETELYIESILPMNPKSRFYEGYNARAAAEDEILAAAAEKYGFTFIDLVPSMVDGNNDLKDEYTSDGLHLTAEGYKVWMSALENYIR
ncbi:MAG: hypothetical protein KBT00_04855 [Bacteroidales bacterium]|nr:hypothetical protein [Candidatus Cacconaster merdequi]